MMGRAPRRVVLACALLVACGSVYASGALPTRPALDDLKAWGRESGISVESRIVERGLVKDTLRDVEIGLSSGAVARTPEISLSRSPFAGRGLDAAAVRVSLRGNPIEVLPQITELEGLAKVDGVRVSRLSIEQRDRSIGSLLLDGVSQRGGAVPRALRAETLVLGNVRWSDVVFSIHEKPKTLEVLLGADPAALPRAKATYVPSDGVGSEWRVGVPHQPLGPLRAALGLGASPPDAATRVAGSLSFIIPDARDTSWRGSFRFVLDGWERPPWPEASAITGSTGALAAVLLPTPEPDGLRLERVEVAAALFELRGSGMLTLRDTVTGHLSASGRRTCAELAAALPNSSYRQAVRDYLGLGLEPAGQGQRAARPADGPGSESVELSLRIDISTGPNGSLTFNWRLSPGCGLKELGKAASGASERPGEAGAP
jgi:hypothetical protein